jgi:hypothetical protein
LIQGKWGGGGYHCAHLFSIMAVPSSGMADTMRAYYRDAVVWLSIWPHRSSFY